MENRKSLPAVASLGDACCGCGACAARCPKGCISMEPDAFGFARPEIDTDACIGCGACDAVCPVLNTPGEDGCGRVLWARAEDGDLLSRSSSGGVFGLLARDALSRGGVVAGAAWGGGCRELRHVLVDDEAGLDAVMRSKYVQSSVGREVYEGVRGALREGRPVLFSGTACQVAAMRSYLGPLSGSGLLLCVDVICHGVPSPGLWRRWLAQVEGEVGGEVRSVNFRSKATGWTSYSVAYGYATEKDGVPRVRAGRFVDDWYMRAFLANASLRPSCLSCPFKRGCGSDITLGDFWGIKAQHPEAFSDDGVSAVLVNTVRGEEALSRIAASLVSGESSLEAVAAGNPALNRPVEPFEDRAAFMRAVAEGVPITEMIRRWGFEPPLARKVLSGVKRVVKRALRL